MLARVWPVNWKEQLGRLRPFIDGNGGVVHVRFSSAYSAPEAFVATVGHLYETGLGQRSQANRARLSMRVDRDVWNNRFLAGVLHLFEKKLGLPPQGRSSVTISDGAQLASENVAGGDQNIQIELYAIGDNHYRNLADMRSGVNRITSAMERFLDHGSFLLIMMPYYDEEVGEFWRDCWTGNLGTLTDRGLTLMKLIDTQKDGPRMHPGEPLPDEVIELPDRLDPAARVHAEQDLALILKRHYAHISDDVARGAARAYIAGCSDRLSILHSELAVFLLRFRA